MPDPTPLVTLPRIEAWLESLPRRKVVYPRYREGTDSAETCEVCLVARYLRDNGFPEASVATHEWRKRPRGPYIPFEDARVARLIELMDAEAEQHSWSASAALTLLRAVEGGQDA